ncbi:DUF5103 domain-containing protein [uncultured Polaribacter sp.]|uniref:type IX secretion system plug protein n=1 Tax=uncultured Polaribacter sp. TaxID=174711 RepID=UPI00261F883F|nr:DUF5103 domain-containing protein [uncultured Polaribacter sp.]
MTIKSIIFFVFVFCANTYSQNIKSVQLRPQQENSFSAIVPLGTILELSFDDLDADSKDYQYKIEHMTHNWESSRLLPSQYIDGFDQNTIINVTNSFNTFQSYTHYAVTIPNINTIITKSGNYLLSVLNDDDEVVFTRRFVFYEKAATVGVSVVRSRNALTADKQQTVQFSINHPNFQINNPQQEINAVIIKNNNWNEIITNINPTFFKPNQLLYTYTNKTNFWGGNEYLNFDTKIIRNNSLNVVKVVRKDVFHHYLYPLTYNPYLGYSFNPDINGQFVIRTIEAADPRTEADYAMMHFSISTEAPIPNKKIYVYGAFNDFKIEEENLLTYNSKDKAYQANILLKQGFYNYTYATVDDENQVDTNSITGSFFMTENEYTVITYYRPFGSLFDRVIGVGTAIFDQNR